MFKRIFEPNIESEHKLKFNSTSEISEWQSDLGVLRAYIRQNLSAIPSSIDTAMKVLVKK